MKIVKRNKQKTSVKKVFMYKVFKKYDFSERNEKKLS